MIWPGDHAKGTGGWCRPPPFSAAHPYKDLFTILSARVNSQSCVGWVTLAGTLTSPHVKHKRSRPNTPVPNSEPFATHHNSCRSPGSLLPSPLASAPNTSRLVSWQEPLATKHRNSSTITRIDILACLATRTHTHTQCHRVVAQPKES